MQEICRSPVEVGSFSHYLHGFFYISAGATVVSRSLKIKKRQIHKKWPDSWALPSLFQPAASTRQLDVWGRSKMQRGYVAGLLTQPPNQVGRDGEAWQNTKHLVPKQVLLRLFQKCVLRTVSRSSGFSQLLVEGLGL